jgi:hypothetical protein
MKTGVLRKVGRELKVHGQSIAARREARALAGRSRPLIVGPWTGEVGFEVLYWIPFLRRLLADSPSGRRVVAVSRGGVSDWYSEVATDYVDLLDFFEPEEVRLESKTRAARRSSDKQTHWTPLDRRAIDAVTERAGLARGEADVLHPYTMYRRYRAVWLRRRSLEVVDRETEFRSLDRSARSGAGGYVAVKAYFSGAFPKSDPNIERLRELVRRLASRTPVRLISSGIAIDDHVDADLSDIPDVETVPPGSPNENLARQAHVVAGADALIATYGGFSYLGPLLGTPTIAFHGGGNFNTVHLDLMSAATQALQRQSSTPERIAYIMIDIRHLAMLDLLAPAESR